MNVNIKTIDIKLQGDSSLIMHKWSEKAKKQIRDKQQKKAASNKKKEARNPEQEYKDATYFWDKKYWFPSVAFKKAAVEACRQVDNMTMTLAKTLFHVIGEYTEIKSDPPIMREDTVVIGMGTTDLRYRPEFKNWSCTIKVQYNADAVSEEQIINIFNLAGFASGIGEDRPNKTGNSFGMFHVA